MMKKKLGIFVISSLMALSSFVSSLPIKANDVNTNLVAYYNFDEGIQSSVGSLSAQLNGNVTRVDTKGVEKGALYFNKQASSNFTVSQAINASSSFSIASWVKYEESNNDKVSLYQQNGSGRTLLYLTPSQEYGSYIAGSDVMLGSSNHHNEYHHVVLTYNASSKLLSCYLNGRLSQTQTINGTIHNGITDLLIGGHKNGAQANALKGYVDELRLYDIEISQSVVEDIYALHGLSNELQVLIELVEKAQELDRIDNEQLQNQFDEALREAQNILNKQDASYTEIKDAQTNLQTMIQTMIQNQPIKIEIDSDVELREIGDEMFGINHRYHNDGYGTYDPEADKIYDEFNAYVKEANFGSIRYPGGAVANLFHWQRAIGPMEQRKKTIHGLPDANAPVVPNFGVDEAMNWIYDDLNSEAIWVYGMGTGKGAQDLADLYEYLNAPNDGTNVNGGVDWAKVRAQNGHEEPYGVRYFEIGNEIGYYAQTYWMDGRPSGMSTTQAYIEGGLMTFNQNTKTVQEEDWRTSSAASNGTANQVRYVKYAPALEGSMQVYVGGTKWDIVSSLENAGRNNVCMVDEESGKITFGDGTNGNIPVSGAQITCAYQTQQDGFVDYSRALKDIAKQLNQEVHVYSCVFEESFTSLMAQKGYNDDYDGVVIHPYSDNGIDENDAQFYEKVLGRSLQYNMPRVEALINRMNTSAPGQNKVPVLSEFGIYKYNSKFIRSLGHAIYIGNEMIDYINYGTPYINKHCLSDYPYQADSLGTGSQCVIQTIIENGEHRFVMTPSAKLYEIMNGMSGDTQIKETILNNPTYYTYQGYDVKTIKTLTTKDEAGNVYLIVVNNAKDQETSISVSLKDFSLNGKTVDVWYLTSDQVDDENTLANPNLVHVEKTSMSIANTDVLNYALAPHSITAFKLKDALQKVPSKVENLKAKDTNYKTITLTWDASENANVYDVYRKAYDSDEFKLYKTVADTTVAVSGVMTGKEYAFYVVAKNDSCTAEASETVVKATTLHGKVTLNIEKVSTSKFNLSWNAIDGATRYIVYRKRNDDKMKKVLTLGANDLEYTTAELPHGDYQFILKAGRYDSTDRIMTDASNTVKGNVEKVAPAVTLKAGTKSIKVSWKAMEGVTHYQVYRATSKDGKYTKLITTKETSYTAKSLKTGKTYYFKVDGYKTYKSGDTISYKVYSDESSVKSAVAK